VAAEACKPFSYPQVGSGTRQNVYNPMASCKPGPRHVPGLYRYVESREQPAQSRWPGRSPACSGRTAVVPARAALDIPTTSCHIPSGASLMSATTSLAHQTLILDRGHMAFMQRSARVWSTFPAGLCGKSFIKQRLAVGPQHWPSDLRALCPRIVVFCNHPFLALHMIEYKGIKQLHACSSQPVFRDAGRSPQDLFLSIVILLGGLVSGSVPVP